jgi:hypothetical protein
MAFHADVAMAAKRSGRAVLVAVMEAAHFWQLHDLAHGWRLDASRLWHVLAQRQMSSGFVVIGKVSGQDATEVAFVEDNDVIKTFSSYRAHKALDIGTLPRCSGCGEDFLDATAVNTTLEVVAVDAVEVADHVLWRCVLART